MDFFAVLQKLTMFVVYFLREMTSEEDYFLQGEPASPYKMREAIGSGSPLNI